MGQLLSVFKQVMASMGNIRALGTQKASWAQHGRRLTRIHAGRHSLAALQLHPEELILAVSDFPSPCQVPGTVVFWSEEQIGLEGLA